MLVNFYNKKVNYTNKKLRGTLSTSVRAWIAQPEILGCTPVFVGTRVPLQALIDYIEAGHPLQEFLDGFLSATHQLAVAALQQAKARWIADARAA